MTCSLKFGKSAWAEWQSLDSSVRTRFKQVLARRLEIPCIESARLHGMPNCYKIKLRTLGYRLVYQVDDGIVTVTVVAVGKHERCEVYQNAGKRLNDP